MYSRIFVFAEKVCPIGRSAPITRFHYFIYFLFIVYISTSLIIHEENTKEINTETEFGYVRKNLHKLTQLPSQFSLKIRICFRRNMKHSEECFNTTSPCFYGYVMKHSSSCFIYQIIFFPIQYHSVYVECSQLFFSKRRGH